MNIDKRIDDLMKSLSERKHTEMLTLTLDFIKTFRTAPSFGLLMIDEVTFFSIRKEILKFYSDENSVIIINDIFDVLESEYIADKLKR